MAKRERRVTKGPSREAAPDAGEGKAGAPRASGVGGAALEWIKSIAVAVVIFIVLRTFLVQTFVITSGSMEDTLLVGDFLVVNRAGIGSRIPFTNVRIPGYSEPRRGDVIVFDPAHEVDLMLVKRLLGMPGDTVSMRERVFYINGRALDEPYVKHVSDPGDEFPDPRLLPPDRDMSWQRDHLAPGVDPASYKPSRDNWGPLVVPEDYYFMLGDNREQSLDSRYWGLVDGWRLEGRAVFIYFSYNMDSFRPFAFLREVRWPRIGDVIR
jgi:signal peptidase I